MTSKTVTVQRSSNVYKAMPGLWHTISSDKREISGQSPFRESVTCIVTKSKSSDDWDTIENAQNHHWLQVRDPDGIRNWIRREYQKLFFKDIPSEDFLITDIHESEIQIYPRTFRCPNCWTLRRLRNDEDIKIQVTQEQPLPSKIGIKCINQNCQFRPVSQQPHIIIDYDTGLERELPTECPNGHPLRLLFTGSVVSVLGWRLNCIGHNCEYNVMRDPFSRKKNNEPYFPEFFKKGQKMSITPTTRGPRRPIVLTRIDTLKFPFKPDENLLASILEISPAPYIDSLFNEWNKMRDELFQRIKDMLPSSSDEEIVKNINMIKRGNNVFDTVEKEMLNADSQFKEVWNASDKGGEQLRNTILDSGNSPDQMEIILDKMKGDFEEIINLSIARGMTYRDFINTACDSRKDNIEEYENNLVDLKINFIRYLFHDEELDKRTMQKSLQIVKVGFGSDNGTIDNPHRQPCHANLTSSVRAKDKNGQLMSPSARNPIIFGTNHPIEGLFIRLNPNELMNKLDIKRKSNNDRASLAMLDWKENEPELSVIEMLLHTFAHIVIKRISKLSGLGLGSLSHRLFPKDGSIMIYTTVHPTLGQLREVFENRICQVFDPLKIKRTASKCPRDPICSQNKIEPANCFACLHIPEHCCDGYWNRKMNRTILWNKDGVSGLWN